MIALSLSPASPADALRSSTGQEGRAAGMVGANDFASLLGRMSADVAVTLREGETAALAGMQGSLPLQTVVDRVMAAERTLQAAIAVRDKAVNAYQEISRMQI